jgi:hypothetical protein
LFPFNSAFCFSFDFSNYRFSEFCNMTRRFQATWDLVPPSVVANQTSSVAPAAAAASSTVLEPVPASQVLKMSFQQAMASNVSPVTAVPSISATSSNMLEIPTQRPPVAQPLSAAEVQQRLHQIPARAGTLSSFGCHFSFFVLIGNPFTQDSNNRLLFLNSSDLRGINWRIPLQILCTLASLTQLLVLVCRSLACWLARRKLTFRLEPPLPCSTINSHWPSPTHKERG